MTNRV